VSLTQIMSLFNRHYPSNPWLDHAFKRGFFSPKQEFMPDHHDLNSKFSALVWDYRFGFS